MNYTTNPPYRSLLVFLGVLMILQSALGQSPSEQKSGIQGKLQLDSIWDPVVYLSHIPTLNDMYTMSNQMIISEAPMDSLGRFSFATHYFSEEDQLYRIHVSKRNSPAASLIIGGEEENHIFLIGNKNANIRIENIPGNPPFHPIEIAGYIPSKEIREIDHIYSYVDSTHFDGSSMKGEFVTQAIYEELRYVADTSAHALVSLYALQKSKFESNYPINQAYYDRYLKKWRGEKSNYFKAFRAQLPRDNSNYYAYIIIGLAFFILGFVLNHFLKQKRKKQANPLQKLSVQERKILEEIKQGRSNKEISEAFNIGISTVKSHVSNIYTKLNIKSRKEAMDF